MDNNQLEHRVKILSFISIVLFFVLMVVLFAVLLVTNRTNQDLTQNTISTKPIDKLEIRQLSEEEIALVKREAENAVASSSQDQAITFDSFYKNKAETDQNISICPLIGNQFDQAECFNQTYLSIAMRDKNLKACDQLSSTDHQVSCRNEINYYLAEENPEQAKDYCNEITTEKLLAMCLNNYVK